MKKNVAAAYRWSGKRARNLLAQVRRAPTPDASRADAPPTPTADARALYKEGRALHDAGAWEEAAAALARAVALDPQPDWIYLLGRTLQRWGRTAEALDAYRRAAELGCGKPGLFYCLAGLLEEAGELDEAAANVALALHTSPDEPAYLRAAGRLLTKLGQPAQGLASLLRALDAGLTVNSAVVAEIAAGLEAVGPGAVPPPAQAARLAAEAELLAARHEREGKWKAALAMSEIALWCDAGQAEAHLRRGRCLLQLRRWEAATEALAVAAALFSPPSAQAYGELATAWRKQKKWWQEIEALEQATALDSEVADWWFNLGDARDTMSRFAEAADAFQHAVRLAPDNGAWHYRLGYALERAGDPAGAETAYAAAMALEPEAQEHGVGYFHARRELWAAAAEAFAHRLGETPRNAELHCWLGRAHDRCYRWAEAAEAYQDALALDPAPPEWHYRLGFVFERAGAFAKAAQAYRAAIRLTSKRMPYWHYRLGYVLHAAGEFQCAANAWLQTREQQALARTEAGAIGEAERQLAEEELDPQHYAASFKKRRSRIANASARRLKALGPRGRHGPASANAWYDLGAEAERLGALDLAAEAYRAALDRRDEHEPLWHYRLGYVLAAAGRHEEACLALRETRVFKRPYGVDSDAYAKTPAQAAVLEYVEHLETLPIRDRVIVYESNLGGSVACNPRAIFLRLLNDPRFADWLHVWSVADKSRVPQEYLGLPNVIFVTKESGLYRRYLATASHLINNSTFPAYFVRRPGQKYLNTWHGTPLKALGKDMRVQGEFMGHKNTARNLLQTTHVISPNPHTTHVLIDQNDITGGFSGLLAETGYPRIDGTLNATSEAKRKLRERLGITPDKPVALYAPTWRGKMSGVEIDSDQLASDLSAMAASGMQVLFRGHHYSEKSLAGRELPVTVAPFDVDTYDLLSIVDVLITDYSSLYFDFLATGRTVLRYMYDLDQYRSERGGMYFDVDALPGPIYRDISDLVRGLNAWLEGGLRPGASYAEGRLEFCPREDGQATDRTIRFFFDDSPEHVVRREQTGKKSLLVFEGHFMPNGITTSCLNLLNTIDPERYEVTVAIEPDTVASYPERMQKLAELPSHAHVLGRVGRLVASAEEQWVIDTFFRHNEWPSPEMKAVAVKAWRREFIRCFGHRTWDATIDFEGYARFWAALFACSGELSRRRSIYLHNDMHAEWSVRYADLKGMFELYRDFDASISVSSAMAEVNRDKLAPAFDLAPEHFDFCPNVIDGNRIRAMSQAELDEDLDDWTGERTIFATLGRLSPEKDHEKLIRAFARLHASHPDARLAILGDGPLRHELDRLVSELGLQDVVKLAGLRSNPFPLLKRADCFVLSSNHEGQPMVLLEAMALSKPIVATDIDGNRGVLADSYGRLVENSEDGLLQGMQSFLDGNVAGESFDYAAYKNEAMRIFASNVLGEKNAGSPAKAGQRKTTSSRKKVAAK